MSTARRKSGSESNMSTYTLISNRRPDIYMLEGYDPQSKQWSDSYVNQGNTHDNMFESREEAEAHRTELVSIFECPEDHVRVVEAPEWWKCDCAQCRKEPKAE